MTLVAAWFLIMGVIALATRKRAAAKHYRAVSTGRWLGRLFPITEEQASANALIVAVLFIAIGCGLLLLDLAVR
jgi:dipeptide/tripeptide permease